MLYAFLILYPLAAYLSYRDAKKKGLPSRLVGPWQFIPGLVAVTLLFVALFVPTVRQFAGDSEVLTKLWSFWVVLFLPLLFLSAAAGVFGLCATLVSLIVRRFRPWTVIAALSAASSTLAFLSIVRMAPTA